MVEEEAREGFALDFKAYDHPLMVVFSLCYMGRNLMAMDYSCLAVIGNLQEARLNWAHLLQIIGREGGTSGPQGDFT